MLQRSKITLVGGLSRSEQVPVVIVSLDVLELVGPSVVQRVEFGLRVVLQEGGITLQTTKINDMHLEEISLLLLKMGALVSQDLSESLGHVLDVDVVVAVLDGALQRSNYRL